MGLLSYSPAENYRDLICQYLEGMSQWPASYILHEFLCEENQAFYFHEFNEQLQAHGLRYVADADRNRPSPF